MLVEDPREFARRGIGAFKRLFGEAVRAVHALAQAHDAQGARHDVVHTVRVDAGDFQTDRVRTAIDAAHDNTGLGLRLGVGNMVTHDLSIR